MFSFDPPSNRGIADNQDHVGGLRSTERQRLSAGRRKLALRGVSGYLFKAPSEKMAPDRVAQLVEQRTFNPQVLGSSPSPVIP